MTAATSADTGLSRLAAELDDPARLSTRAIDRVAQASDASH